MPNEDFGEVYDGNGKLLMSAFYRSHAHTPMTLMRGYGGKYGASRLVKSENFSFEDHLTADSVYYGALLGDCRNVSQRHRGYDRYVYASRSVAEGLYRKRG